VTWETRPTPRHGACDYSARVPDRTLLSTPQPLADGLGRRARSSRSTAQQTVRSTRRRWGEHGDRSSSATSGFLSTGFGRVQHRHQAVFRDPRAYRASRFQTYPFERCRDRLLAAPIEALYTVLAVRADQSYGTDGGQHNRSERQRERQLSEGEHHRRTYAVAAVCIPHSHSILPTHHNVLISIRKNFLPTV
jgi:hypothetical protein